MITLSMNKALLEGGNKGLKDTNYFGSLELQTQCFSSNQFFKHSIAMEKGCFFTSEEYCYCGHDMQFISPKIDNIKDRIKITKS